MIGMNGTTCKQGGECAWHKVPGPRQVFICTRGGEIKVTSPAFGRALGTPRLDPVAEVLYREERCS